MNIEWNGEGLPPIGVEVDIIDIHERLRYGQNESGEVVAHVENTAVVRMSYGLGCFEAEFLRPVSTEAQLKRSHTCDKIYGAMCNAERKDNRSDMAEAVYDAIAAGKIPHITLK